MKTLALIILCLTLTACGGYNVKDDGILLAPIETVFLYWGAGIDKEERAKIPHSGEGVNFHTIYVVHPTR